MTVIGTLSVNLVATTEKFVAGLRNAQTGIKKFMGSSLGGALGGLAAAGTVTGLIGGLKESIAAADALGDTATRLGVTAQALGALRFAGDQLGSSAAAMDRSLAMFAKTLGMAQQGSKTATEALSRLGLSAKQLAGIPLDQAFLASVKAIEQLGTSTEQAAAAQQLFGRAGSEMLPVIRAGTDAIIEQGIEIQKMGGLLTGPQAEAMDIAQRNLQKFTKQWEALKLQFALTAAPAFTNFLTFLSDSLRQAFIWATKLEGVLDRWIQLTRRGLGLGEDSASFTQANKDRTRSLAALQGTGAAPLSAPNMSRLQAASEMQVKQLDTLIQEVRRSPVKVAGVR